MLEHSVRYEIQFPVNSLATIYFFISTSTNIISISLLIAVVNDVCSVNVVDRSDKIFQTEKRKKMLLIAVPE